MLRSFIPAVFIVSLALAPAQGANVKTEKDKCFELVKDVTEMFESEETPRPGEKAEAEVTKLIEIATHLCSQGNFVYAEELMQIARTMLSSE